MKNPFDFTDRVVIITGAAGGIGGQAVLGYAETGAKIAAMDIQAEKLEEVARQAREMGAEVLAIPCDIRSEESVNAAVKQVFDAWGRVDFLLNIAGVALGMQPESPMEAWDLSMDVNLRGQWLMMRAVIPYMVEKNYGKIVNIASANAQDADKQIPLHPYCASKSGVQGMTRSVAAFYANRGININCVSPALFLTDMVKTWPPEKFEEYNTWVPIGRPARPDELNGVLLFLTSELSSYISGANIPVDGGSTTVY